MRILIVGAGAIGGYFGGRLLEKGEDVTFLVREKRKTQLEETGLKIDSVNGDSQLIPKLITAENAGGPFDVVVISTKAYQLTEAIENVRPFVGQETMILPLLNGISHIDTLIEAFGDEAVIGGLCFIESTLDENGAIIQTSLINQLVYGERTGEKTERILKLQKAFEGTKADFVLSEEINRGMWHKYLFITAMSGITTMMESPIGPIRELDAGRRTIAALIEELAAVMLQIGAPVKETIAQEQIDRINSIAPGMKSSMQRDVEKLLPIEADHLQGYLLKKASAHNMAAPILETIYTKLSLYEKTIHKN